MVICTCSTFYSFSLHFCYHKHSQAEDNLKEESCNWTIFTVYCGLTFSMAKTPSRQLYRIQPTEMLSFRYYSHFIKLCLYWGDTAKPTDSSAMWPEKHNCINKAALRCRATFFIFVKIPHCYSIPSPSACLLIGPSACPTGNLAYVAKLLAAM